MFIYVILAVSLLSLLEAKILNFVIKHVHATIAFLRSFKTISWKKQEVFNKSRFKTDQEAKPDAKLTCNLVRMRNKRPLAYQHQHPSFWRQLEILRKLKIGSSMGNFL